MNYYILTIKNNTKPCDKYGIDKIYNNISQKSNFNSNFTYENDSHMKLHAHAIVGFNKVPYFKKYQTKGYHVHFKEFPEEDINKVRRYLLKEEDGLLSNYYYHNYSMVY